MSSLPPILDIRDDLNRAQEAADAEADEEFRTLRDRLDEFAERDAASREGVLDEIDNQLLRLEELLGGEAARSIGAARNRIHNYRRARDETVDDVAVVTSSARERGAEDPERTEAVLPVGEATVSVTVANAGDDREVVPVVTLFDERGDELETVRGESARLPAGEQRQFEVTLAVPSDATTYAASVVEAGSPGAV